MNQEQEIENSALVFEDLANLSDDNVANLLRELDNRTLATALKTTDSTVIAKIFNNMFQRAVALMREDMESMGQPRLSDVERAQLDIVQVLRAQMAGKPLPHKPYDEEVIE